MDLKEKQLSADYRFRGHIINVRVDEARMPDGQIVSREVVEHPGGVGIALEDEEGKFFLVTQWRYAQEQVTIEFPAGKREKGEDDLLTARREIIEETGYEGEDFVYLGSMIPTGAYDSEQIGMNMDSLSGIRTARPTIPAIPMNPGISAISAWTMLRRCIIRIPTRALRNTSM